MARSDNLMLTAEELRLHRRQRRRIIVVIALALLLALVGIFAGHPISGAIKSCQARRHAARVSALLEQQRWTDARDEAVAAYQLRPNEPQALRAVARYLSRTRQQQALDFWEQLEREQPLPRDDLRDEATIALMSGETARAEDAVKSLLARKDAGAPDWFLAAQLALQKGNRDEVQNYLQKILDTPLASEREQVQAAAGQLAIASDNDRAKARRQASALARLKKLSHGSTETALDALVVLAQHALSNSTEGTGSLPSSKITGAAAGVPPIRLPELAHALENHPLARAPQKLLALDLIAHDDPAQYNAAIVRALADWKDADPTSLAALATWLNFKGEYQKTIDTIPLGKALQTRELFLQHLDALGALGRWGEIKRLLESEKFPLDPVVQRMYLARCYAKLGEKTAAENNWQRALEAAENDVQKLLTVADYAEKNGTNEIAESAYDAAVASMPKLRAAQEGRLRLAQASRATKRIHAVLADMLKVWPNNTAIQNDEAYARLLLLPDDISSSDELLSIEHLAEELVQREPASLPHRTLLALARLKQHRPFAALEVYGNLELVPNAFSPSAVAVHAAVLAANDRRDDARHEIKQAPLDKLLPEEQAGTADLRE
jgi:tetratricopeptide (TPR) repeat protein